MKYKVLNEFLPGVIVGQECDFNHGSLNVDIGPRWAKIAIETDYAKQHPSIFQPIVEPVELKENETEFNYISESSWIRTTGTCNKCEETVDVANFCSNCGRKRKI